jgi:hypothetical protein
MSRGDNWSYGVIKDDKTKLQPLLNALRRLRQRKLTAGMVAAMFHHRRVLPLMQRRLWIDEMTSDASLEGSRMSHETLPHDEVARRAQWMVCSFKQEDIDKVPMWPFPRFKPLVSVALLVQGSLSFPGLVDLNLSSLPRRICSRSKTHRHRSQRIAPPREVRCLSAA